MNALLSFLFTRALASLLLAFTLLIAFSTTSATDAKVWVNTSSGVYHCPGTRYYGAIKSGRYMSETDAENGEE